MKGLTVKKLYDILATEMAMGNGDKEILLSDDDECNGFHTAFEGVVSNSNAIKDWFKVSYNHDGQNPEDVIIIL